MPVTTKLAVFGVVTERLRIQEPSPPMRGTWHIKHQGLTSSAYSYNTKASDIQADLNANFPHMDNRLSVSGSIGGDGGEF